MQESKYQCTKCNEVKPQSEFSPRKTGNKPVHSWCRVCFRGYSNELNKSPIRQRVRRSYHLKYLYDVSPDTYSDMYEQQEGKCAICNQEESLRDKEGNKRLLAVDHCHTTNEVRGLLCRSCNVAIGLLKEDKTILQSAIDYLKNFDNLARVKEREDAKKTRQTSEATS